MGEKNREEVVKRKTPMKQISERRKEKSKTCRKLRLDFLISNPECCICKDRSVDVHHSKRRGKHYLAVEFFKPLCRSCHRKCHDNPAWGKEMGLL